ncbi:VTT domain-containing protein [Alphaproteobacteria bacterium]|nr:VTT domain-containing protein [Alphaproteobacteria bacterium]
MKTKIKILDSSFFEKIIQQSKSIYARVLLYFISFIEAIFFPIPVDPLLAILVLNNKEKYIQLTIFCTLASVFGGIIGWFLGYIIGEEIEELFTIIPWIKYDSFNAVREAFDDHGILIIFLGAFTPLPFKIISVTSGVFHINIAAFFVMSLIGRGLRFFLVSLIVKNFGEKGIYLLKKHTFIISSLCGLILIMLYLIFV